MLFDAMLSDRFAPSTAPLRDLKQIQYGILSPDEITAHSVVKVEYPEVLDKTTNTLKIGGLMDPRMGTIDASFHCATCRSGVIECPGHFGHIELSRPVLHPGFIPKIKKILGCICLNCGRLRSSDNNFISNIRVIRDPQRRVNLVWEHCKTRFRCERNPAPIHSMTEEESLQSWVGCGHEQPFIERKGHQLFIRERGPRNEKCLLRPAAIYSLFCKISESDVHLLGLSAKHSRPEWMIITILPIPPPSIRPSVLDDDGTRVEDTLTIKLCEIIKTSDSIRRAENDSKGKLGCIEEMERFLQFQVATYIGTEFPNAKNGASIRARLNGKAGRIRRNLVTKPVDFCARTVVTGDPNIELDEVGVPRSIVMNLTYPERVTRHNLSYLQALVRNGPDRYPGARFVIRDTGERLDLRDHRHDGCALQYGWTVERHLRDGDYALLNRQPAWYKAYMMSHRVKVMPYSTFRVNSAVVPAYNIKFDGDEMNLHVPQSELARAELSQLASISRQIISPRHAKPIMGLTEDTLVGVRRFTLRDMFLDWAHVQNILLWISDWDGRVPIPAIVKPKPLWTGKQILGLMIPCGIHVFRQPTYYPGRRADFNLLDDGMLIKNGDITYGTVDKRSVGAPGGSLIEIIFRERGPEAASQFLTDLQLVVNYWLFHHGFSVGIGDAIVPSDTASICAQRLTSDKQDVEKLIDDAAHDRLRAAPSLTLRETFEVQMNFILARARDYQGSYAWKAMQMQNNNISTMINAGSSGSFLNFTQMAVCVGQQLIESRRIPFGFQHRTLPHFAQDDFGAKARGFVENSYFRGLAPHEFFFHAMAARGDLVNTIDETAETGYIHRGLARALQDLTVCYDGTVRNSRRDVIQLLYGEDGMDESCVGTTVAEIFASSDTAFQGTYTFDASRLANPDSFEDAREILPEEYAQLTKDRELTRSFIYPHFDWIQRHRHRYLPVDIRHLIHTACDMFEIDHQTKSDLTPGYIIHSVKDLCQRLVVVRGEDPIGEEARRNAVLWFQIQLRSVLSSQQVINGYHYSREAFDWVLRQVESSFKRALVHAGEMCGMVAAQSIGGATAELSRDFTPDWRPGVSSSNIKAGKPGITRLKEILSATNRINYPSLTIYLDRETGDNSSMAQLVANKIEYTSLRDIVSAVEIWYDPDPATTLIEQDDEVVQDFFAIPDEEVELSLHLHSPWLLRFELNRRKMVGPLSMAHVAACIANNDGPNLFCIWNEDNADKLIIRCRIVRQNGLSHQGPDFLGLFADQLLDLVVVGGVRDVDKVLMLQQAKIVVEENGKIGWKPNGEWVLETHGSNLKTVMSIDGVDWRRTYSNSCVEIFQVLGIEAARAALLKEIRHVLEWDGSYVGYRHLSLLCDWMTHRGQITPLDRNGEDYACAGALRRCILEDTIGPMLEGATIGEKEDIRRHGIVESAVLGQMPHMGTGVFEVISHT